MAEKKAVNLTLVGESVYTYARLQIEVAVRSNENCSTEPLAKRKEDKR